MPKSQERHLRIGSRAASLLEELVDTLDLILTTGYQPAAVLTYGIDGVRFMRSVKERRLRRQTMRRLEKQQLIKIEKRADRFCVALTKHGAEDYFRLQLLRADLLPESTTCFVVFDIPESQRKVRDHLRLFLESAGFAPMQKSVWVSRFDVVRPLRRLLKLSGYQKWVRIYLAIEQKD